MRATVQCRKSPALKIRSGPEGATAATAIAGTANASDVAARYDETWGNSDIAVSWLSAKEGASQYGDGCIRTAAPALRGVGVEVAVGPARARPRRLRQFVLAKRNFSDGISFFHKKTFHVRLRVQDRGNGRLQAVGAIC